MIRPVCQQDFCENCGRCLYCHGGDLCADGEREHTWPDHLRDPITSTGLPRCGLLTLSSGDPCRLPTVAGSDRCWRHKGVVESQPLTLEDLNLPCHRCNYYPADRSIVDGLCWRCGKDQVEDESEKGM